ncbi:MAG: thiazole synthase [Clostridium butyricum]|jgi:thiazole synthase|uniref:thiazole synthase n=1 Tax=unclassified Neomoorella TaxID=2676739 RepID=UPI0010FFAD13|nr:MULTISPECIES: thiazole synthase [unclassified Moorella (in: firmicutes)]MDK2815746.1 thiazole synthase [Moorella sp. (in: firmicutes)]MDK2829899.1 thiazole synthase [Clostridium butyricum]MDK2894308.1 thiazole synthase [Moorella sp. (in: firmicutes)]GEA16417.1 thiazole synthase [Moorella sp. E308F]GEA17405.1 thiazole synthase [Moorella sp. E306M]
MNDKLVIAGREFNSRLMVGTGKYATMELMQQAIAASGAEIVTVAVRRINLQSPGPSLLDYLDLKKITLLPNTAGATTVDEAVRLARLAREAGLSDMVKLEVIGDQETLLPDPVATIEATRILVKEGFIVLPYTTQDVVVARRLVEAGAATVMPLGSPIGSGQGLPNFDAIRLIIDRVNVPVIVDAGIGAPSDAALAMEIGASACLINTAIAEARDPVLMATAMREAVIAGRLGYLAGRIPKKTYASPSSPTEGMIGRG